MPKRRIYKFQKQIDLMEEWVDELMLLSWKHEQDGNEDAQLLCERLLKDWKAKLKSAKERGYGKV